MYIHRINFNGTDTSVVICIYKLYYSTAAVHEGVPFAICSFLFYLQMKILIIKLAIIKLLNVSFENFFNETILTRS